MSLSFVVICLGGAWLAARMAVPLYSADRQRLAQALLRTSSACAGLACFILAVQLGSSREHSLLLGGRAHAAADLNYLKAVSARLAHLRQSAEVERPDRRALVGRLQSDLADWTARIIVGHTGFPAYDATAADDSFRRAALVALAQAIHPREPCPSSVEDYWDREAILLQQGLAEALTRQQQTQAQRSALSEQLRLATDSQQTTSEAQRDQTARLAVELTQLETQQQAAAKTRARFESRLEMRQTLRELPAGLNATHAWLRLPEWLPGGILPSLNKFIFKVVLLVYLLVGLWRCRPGHLSTAGDLPQRVRFVSWVWGIACIASLVFCVMVSI